MGDSDSGQGHHGQGTDAEAEIDGRQWQGATLNTSEAHRQKSQEIIRQMIELGLPECQSWPFGVERTGAIGITAAKTAFCSRRTRHLADQLCS